MQQHRHPDAAWAALPPLETKSADPPSQPNTSSVIPGGAADPGPSLMTPAT